MKRSFLADLHVHSTFSDGQMTIPEIVDFYGKRGFGAVAVTDHICEEKGVLGRAASYLNLCLTPATFPIYREILRTEAERAWQTYGLVLIAGFELSKNSLFNHRSAHVLGLGIKEFMSADGDVRDLARKIREQGGLAIAAHPVATGKFEPQTYHLWSRREELKDCFDAWEVASGSKFSHEVQESGLPLLATGDLHRASQIESWKTVFTCERSVAGIFEAIRKQDLSFTFYKEKSADSQLRAWLRAPGTFDLGSGDFYGGLGNVAHAQTS